VPAAKPRRYAQHVAMRSMSLCAACRYAQHVAMRSMSLCAACRYAQHVAMRSMSLRRSRVTMRSMLMAAIAARNPARLGELLHALAVGIQRQYSRPNGVDERYAQ
jgi:hypothetical protein